MIKHLFSIILILASTSVWAAKSNAEDFHTSTSVQNETQKIKSRELLKHISMFGFYNMSDKSSFEGSGGGASSSGEINTTNSYGLGLETQLKTLNNGMIVKGGAGYEFGRIMNKSSGREGNQKFNQTFDTPKPELSAWIVYLQAELPVSNELSFFGGGNFNFPTVKNVTGSYSGKIGWQAGMTFYVSDNFYVDGMWRSFNYTGNVDNYTFDNINVAGALLRGRVSFE
jgi:hypothetical protein